MLLSIIAWGFFSYFALGILGIIVLLAIETPLEKPLLMLISLTIFRDLNSGLFTLDNTNIPQLVMTWSIGVSLVFSGLEFIFGKRFNKNLNMKIGILIIFLLNLLGYIKMWSFGITIGLFFTLTFVFTTIGLLVYTKINQFRSKLAHFSDNLK